MLARGLGPGTQIVASSESTPADDRTALRCFAAAIRNCAHAKIVIAPLDSPVNGVTVFAIEAGGRPSACQVAREFPRPPVLPVPWPASIAAARCPS